jgi:hypothetical protein
MNWAVWLILLIPVAVSILSLLFRPPKEEPRRGGRLRPNPPDGANPPRPARRSVSDIDQFLEEINRRRREAAERRRAPEPPPLVPPREERPAPALPPRPRPAPPPERPARRPERETPLVPPRVRERVPEPRRMVIAEAVVAPVEAPPAPRIEVVEAAAVIVAQVQRPRRAVSPALAQLLPLLSRPQGLRNAVLLREIFEGPVSRRPHRSPFITQLR